MTEERQRRALIRAGFIASYATAAGFFPLEDAFHADFWGNLYALSVSAGIFGFGGAALFLWPAFYVASLIRLGRWAYPFAGAWAGIAHTIIARLTMTNVENVPFLVPLTGGFWLAGFLDAGRFEIFRLMLPACLGGLVAGYYYDLAVGPAVIIESGQGGPD